VRSSFAMHIIIPDLRNESLMINGDIDTIIQCEKEHTVELNSKYEGLNLTVLALEMKDQ
jgi:hypothetical protein